MPEVPQVIVNGIGLTGIDLSQGLSVSNVAGRVVVNGQEVPEASAANGLTVSGGANITNANTGAATSNGNGGVEISGIAVGSIETAGSPVMLNLANTESADASNSLAVEAAPATALDMLVTPAAEQVPLGFYSLPDFGPDWLFG
ncbi:hypothetical protein GCM10011504_24500 [Siccirubricoccus deserti]|uniref:Uncharacterized protein n=1 Tax=Siccirubricoccus deserti TaxID=2013562 RepID=A0A9X0QXW8_9PROT|nr:hypothetical protein [Siccirubricoccus deserti]MBC4015859.1 hypothetical protein [Siccirubricoccus deserti]GGC45188.1 hypothetical protein GCM10011504_24500 [Siccirubricoccus deserti]